jgi:hypothetical protein
MINFQKMESFTPCNPTLVIEENTTGGKTKKRVVYYYDTYRINPYLIKPEETITKKVNE